MDSDSVKYKSRKYDSQSDDERSEKERRLKNDKKKRKIHPESDSEKYVVIFVTIIFCSICKGIL